jgi:hypothetical protein
MEPRGTDIVQPKVRLRKALHRRLTAAARANKASLNGEIVRRLEESFVHQALAKRLSGIKSPIGLDYSQVAAFEERMRQMGMSIERLLALLETGVLAQYSDGMLRIFTEPSPASIEVVEAPGRKRKTQAKGERYERPPKTAGAPILGSKGRNRPS